MSSRIGTRTLAGYAMTFVIAGALGFATGKNAQDSPPPQVQSFLALMNQRSPGARTADELTKTRRTPEARIGSVEMTLPPVSAVPEPDTWAMMLVGFALIGFAIRNHRVPSIPEAAPN